MFQIHRVYSRKHGVALQDPDLWQFTNTWLNEAITEWLAIRLSGYAGDVVECAYKGSFSYPFERRELDRLLAAGLEENIVINAYFENFSSKQSKRDRGRHYARLIQRIRQLEGVHGLARLENSFVMGGVEHQLSAQDIFSYVENIDNGVLSPDLIYFDITISVGRTSKTAIRKKFVYFVKPGTTEQTDILVQNKRLRVEKILSGIRASVGHNLTYTCTPRSEPVGRTS